MADAPQEDSVAATPVEDVEMAEQIGDVVGGEEGTGLPDIEPEAPRLVLFADLVKSGIVEVIVGTEGNQTTYSAHEAVLVKSPELAKQVEQLDARASRRLYFADVDVDAMGSVVEYLYTGEYFPKRTSGARDAPLEKDPRLPDPDDQGLGLLAHARVYTLADRLALPALKSLAHSKIHRTASNAKGELAYARYVYKESNADDDTIRKPVAAFWASRSYALRHDAEPQFKAMCLEFPQFAFDVLQLVLDQQEKSRKSSTSETAVTRGGPSVVPGSTRKRARVSQI